jgi:lipopolysaccharide transport system permease protein
VAILALFFDVLSPTLYLLPAALLLATVTLASLAMVAAACHVYFSDTGFLVNFLLLAVFYLTPAVYPLSYIPEGWKVLYLLNPAASQVELLRAIVLGFPEATAPLLWCVLAGQAAVFLPLGYLAFLPLEKRMGEVL